MNRLQKKCFVFSVGMHCLLVVILLGSAAFRDRPDNTEAPVLNLIPSTLLDQAGAGGGEPAPMVRAAQPPAQPQAQAQPQVQQPRPQPRQVQPPPQPAQPVVVRHVERPRPQEEEVETHPVARSENAIPRPIKTHHHEIHPTFTPTTPTRTHRTTENTEASEEAAEAAAAASAARAEARRRNEIQSAIGNLASNVRSSGAGRTIVDVPGIGGGGELFAGYWDAVKAIYSRNWMPPENGTDKSRAPEARITVSRDGSILSAELVSPSGDTSWDRSVSRTLRDVTKLPSFPAGARDEQRTFTIKFSLDLKEATG